MNDQEYKYDVAFSFTTEDENLATQINDLIQDRLTTFLYSKRQEEIAGTDGEETFSKVFGEEARVVVVLYRDTWGQTRWTRIEETAIKNRAFDEGYEFVLFVPVAEGVTLPKWLPKTQLWIGYNRWGVDGTASVIEARVQQYGGSSREESVSDRAARIKRQMDAETDRKEFLNSIAGVQQALEETEAIIAHVEEVAVQVEKETGFVIKTTNVTRGIDACARYGCLAFSWYGNFSNSLAGSYLSVKLWDGTPPRPGRMFFDKPRQLREVRYSFDRSYDGKYGWRETRDRTLLSSERLAESCLKSLMDYSHREHIKRPR